MRKAGEGKEAGAIAPEIPNPTGTNSQGNLKSEFPKGLRVNSALVFGFWSLLGAWVLGFGISGLAKRS
jgi:hypothetical protein